MGNENQTQPEFFEGSALIDFLYVDNERVDSLISQLRNGTLRSVTKTIGTSEGSSVSVRGSAGTSRTTSGFLSDLSFPICFHSPLDVPTYSVPILLQGFGITLRQYIVYFSLRSLPWCQQGIHACKESSPCSHQSFHVARPFYKRLIQILIYNCLYFYYSIPCKDTRYCM